MIDSVVHLLRCPVCSRRLAVHEHALRCSAGHSFDIARQGYVNLLTRTPKGANADTADMIAARDRFLSGGHYQALAARLAGLAATAAPDDAVIIEAGAGTGYYLGEVLTAIPGARGIAADLSPVACRRAARVSDRIGTIVADTWAGLPIKDAAADLIMVVFAPRNPGEFARLLSPGGRLLIATPSDDHLVEIRDRLGMIDVRPGKPAQLQQSLRDWFAPDQQEDLKTTLRLGSATLADLVLMGPTAHHRKDDLEQRIAALPAPTAVTLSVTLSVFRRR
ncbi:SAM-dependent methyltransferase [Microlunatus endophyticus]|uniref:SAM-dependent methyltransferase n=1 Tax=Microlunatus endophyticus TaxID=1716077 RepID=A0A917SAG7_9ACTN|nr:hypothetical protein [Microlunatus endophyticus]GGL68050.1 SAM-dependent methyltransferase [Microlunatus endophyticus]